MAKKRKPGEKIALPKNDSIQRETGSETHSNQPLTQLQFIGLLLFLGFFVVYFMAFLFVETEIGARFSLYLSLILNAEIYWTYWTGSPTGSIHLVDRLPIVLGVLFHFLMAMGIGRLVTRFLLRAPTSRLEKYLIDAGIGLSLISVYTVGVAWFQILHGNWVLVVPTTIVSLAGWFYPRIHSNSVVPVSEQESRKDWLILLVQFLAVPFIGFIFLASMIPPWEFDVREYHLQVPKEWFQQGGASFMSHNVYGNMPLGTEMHALFAMFYSFSENEWWWGVLIGKTVSGIFSILTTVAIYCIGNRLFGRFAGSVAAVLFVSTPWITANGIIGYNENAIAFYTLLGLLLFLLIRPDSGTAESKNKPHPELGNPVRFFGNWLLVGFAIGSAVACKYTVIPFVAIPAWLLGSIWIQRQTGAKFAAGMAAWMGAGMAVACVFWFLKNGLSVGNPFYPLAESVFGQTRSPDQIEQWGRAHRPDTVIPTLGKFGSIIMSLGVSFKWLSPLTLPLAVVAFFGRKTVRVWWMVAYLGFVFVLWLMLTHRLERFLLPFYGIGCLLAGAGANVFEKGAGKKLVVGLVLLGSLANLLFSSSRLVGDVRIFASMDELDLRSLEAKDYFHPEGNVMPMNALSRTIAWLNRNHPQATVLLFGECRPLTAEFKTVYNTCFDTCETWKLFHNKSTPDILQSLHDRKISFIVVNQPELQRFYQTYGYNVADGGNPVTPESLAPLVGTVLVQVTEHLREGGGDAGVLLFRVVQ